MRAAMEELLATYPQLRSADSPKRNSGLPNYNFNSNLGDAANRIPKVESAGN